MKSSWSQEVYIKACRFAAEAHNAQLYPGTNLPYLMHLSLVAMEVVGVMSVESGHDGDLAIQCALLHDTIEDTDITYSQLASEFGIDVADGVKALSKDPAIEKSDQLPDSLARICLQPNEIWIVKLADRITNLQSPPVHWDRAKVIRYRQEAIAIHTALESASPYLAARLTTKIESYLVYIDRD